MAKEVTDLSGVVHHLTRIVRINGKGYVELRQASLGHNGPKSSTGFLVMQDFDPKAYTGNMSTDRPKLHPWYTIVEVNATALDWKMNKDGGQSALGDHQQGLISFGLRTPHGTLVEMQDLKYEFVDLCLGGANR